MQESMHAAASIPTSKKGEEYDFKFKLPSDDWEKVSHGAGDRKSSVWLFKLKSTGQKILLTCAGTKESPEFAKSALSVYESSRKIGQDLTREWKLGNFTIKRSFIGYIDEQHGEVTISAFSPTCTLEFNIANETMKRNDLFTLTEKYVEEFVSEIECSSAVQKLQKNKDYG
jgi:hypothetical protein